MRETQIDKQTPTKPCETVLVAHSGVIDPTLSPSVLCPLLRKHEDRNVKQRIKMLNSERLKRAPRSCVLAASFLEFTYTTLFQEFSPLFHKVV
jgi:hypothetical protein